MTGAEKQKAYRDRQTAKKIALEKKSNQAQIMAETMFEFIKREAHYYQERSRHASQYTDRMDFLLRQERAKIIDAVLLGGKPYQPEFEYPTPGLLYSRADLLLTDERAGYELPEEREA